MSMPDTAQISADQLNRIFGASFIGVTVHRDFRLLYCNARTANLLGYANADVFMDKGDLARHIPAGTHKRLLDRWHRIMDGNRMPDRNRVINIACDGREIWLDVTDERMMWGDGKPAIFSTMTDVSTAVLANESLLSSMRRLEDSLDSILDTIPTGVAIFSESGRPRMVNSAMRALFQEDPHPSPDVPAAMADLMARMVRTDQAETTQRGVTTPMGRVVDLVARRMDDDAIMLCAADVSDWQARQDKLKDMADHDMLTGLLNRRGFWEAAKPMLRRALEGHLPCATMIVDIDHFKQINDTHGHATGDQALKSIAKRLTKELRDGDMIARIGGEEFCIFLPKCDAETAERIAERLRAKVAANPFSSGGQRISLTASFGLRTWDGKTPTRLRDLLAAADAALYRAKQLGRDRVVVA